MDWTLESNSLDDSQVVIELALMRMVRCCCNILLRVLVGDARVEHLREVLLDYLDLHSCDFYQIQEANITSSSYFEPERTANFLNSKPSPKLLVGVDKSDRMFSSAADAPAVAAVDPEEVLPREKELFRERF